MATGHYPRRRQEFSMSMSSGACYHGLVMPVVMIRCRRSYYKEQWVIVVAEEDLVKHESTTSGNGHTIRCRHCCTSRMTVVDGRSSQQMHLSKYLQRRLSVMGISYLLSDLPQRWMQRQESCARAVYCQGEWLRICQDSDLDIFNSNEPKLIDWLINYN